MLVAPSSMVYSTSDAYATSTVLIMSIVIADIAAQCGENAVYHLAAPEQLDYAALFDVLRSVCDRPVNTFPVTVEEVIAQNLPLPFPLTAAESELFDGSRVCRELGLRYTPVKEGMEKAYLGVKQVLEER